MIITAPQYATTPVYDLLAAAANGLIGIDQRLLHAIVDRGEAAVEDIVRFGLEDRLDDRINLDDDLITILQYIGSPKSLPLLIEFLRRDPVEPSEDMLHSLQRAGDSAIPELLKLYADLGPEIGGDLAFVLASFRNRDARILKVLERRASHDPGDAAFLMGVHGDPGAKPMLERLKQQAITDAALATSLGKEADEALASLDAPESLEIPEPISLWDLYPEHLEPVFDVLTIEERIEFLKCPSAELRADAATSFIDRELPGEVIPVLVELAKGDPNVGVRAVSCTALSGVADEVEVSELLVSKLRDRKLPPPERCGALLGLAPAAKSNPELRGYIDEFYANPGTMARAIEAMWRSMDTAYVDIFKRHLSDADFDIRRQAIKGVGFAQAGSEAKTLQTMFEDEEFRLDALFSYALCVPVGKLKRGDMPQLMRKIEDIAGGLSEAEGEVVETALDTRLVMHGLEPVFLSYDPEDEEA
ncbi:MAG: hypothetical protein HY820_23140 [Acidobacteria bacterium]|nr:hypothetical protein [Acidobacteriota bacterium]